jgi:hypothetical protein
MWAGVRQGAYTPSLRGRKQPTGDLVNAKTNHTMGDAFPFTQFVKKKACKNREHHQ